MEEKKKQTEPEACKVAKKCGGCQYQGVPYKEQLKKKQKMVNALLSKYGKVEPIIGMENPYYYRNKVHAVFDRDRKGNIVSGTYEAKTHRVVPVENCLIEDKKSQEIIRTIRGLLKSFKIKTYDEDTGYGLFRHVLIRRGFKSGEIMVVLVLGSPMVTRACISINNRCNLNCTYCHFHEKKDYIQEDNMDVITILDIIASHIEDNDIDLFKLGFVGNGEPMLDYEKLKQYIAHIGDYLKSGRIAAYTITNGLLVDREKLEFFKEYNVNVGFSVDGISAIHDKYRCGTHERVMANIALYKEVNGKYPSMNCTVGKEIIDNPEATIGFFEQFGNRITFSRMIGKQEISLPDFNAFLNKAMERLNVRTGGYDCTMYGGMCGAGMDNIFYANGKIFICGNCIDLPFSMPYDTPLNEVSFDVIDFDRSCCFKEVFTG